MKLSLKTIALCIILFLFSNLYSRQMRGIGLEIGAGHNQLFWSTADFGNADRTQFSLTPNINLIYDFKLNGYFSIIPFIGYNKFGGKSGEEPNGYKDKYWIQAVEGGFHLLYRYNRIRFGTGIKYSRHIKARCEAYGGLVDQGEDRVWKTYDDRLFFFKNYSYSLSARAGYLVTKHIHLALDAWFGLNNFANSDIENMVTIKQNHYRFLIGFVL